MIKTYRLENLLMSGQVTGEGLDELLAGKHYLGAMYQLRSNRQALLEIASSPVALETLCNSRLGIDTLTVGGDFLDVLFSNEIAFGATAFSDAALANLRVRRTVCDYVRAKPWTTKMNITAKLADLCYVPELELHVGVGTNISAVSSDGGETWENGTLSGAFNSVCWNPEQRKFVAVGAGKSAVSEDGLNWTVYNTTATLNSVCYGAGQYVGVGASAICTSNDGINWVNRHTANTSWQCVCYAPSRRTFYAVNSTANTNNLGVSGDGVTWTTLSVSGAYGRIAWDEDTERLTATGSANLSVATVSGSGSPSWSAKTKPTGAGNLSSICFAPEFSLCAVLAGASLITSADGGDSWSVATVDTGHTRFAISWDTRRRRFVCVSDAPSVLTSYHWRD